METQSPNIYVEKLSIDDVLWFVETAAVNMLTDELKRPDYINIQQLYALTTKVMGDGTAFVAKRAGEPIGAIASLLSPNIYNPNLTTMVELFWYVAPEHRNTRAGALLFSAFDQSAERLANEGVLSILPDSKINPITLNKRGFVLGEYAFRKEYRKT